MLFNKKTIFIYSFTIIVLNKIVLYGKLEIIFYINIAMVFLKHVKIRRITVIKKIKNMCFFDTYQAVYIKLFIINFHKFWKMDENRKKC